MRSSAGKILLVDDDDYFRSATARTLEAMGYACLTADDVEDAWRLLESESPSVVISDICIPGNDNLEFVRRVAASESDPGIILVTGYPSLETAVDAIDLHLVGYLVKPFEIDDLSRRINEAIRMHARARAIRKLRDRAQEFQKEIDSLSDAEPADLRIAGKAPDVSFPTSTSARPAEIQELIDRLTPRESEIVANLEEGYRLSTIGKRLGISTNTARRHLKNIFLKLEVASQAELLEKLKPWAQ